MELAWPVKPGVISGRDMQELYKWAKSTGTPISAVNCAISTEANAFRDVASRAQCPIIFAHFS